MRLVNSEGFTAHRCMAILLTLLIPKMTKLKLAFVGTFVALCGFAAHAEGTDKAPGSGPNPFADCGIGAALFTDTKWAAVTSNVIWDVGTTAVTSATLSPQTCSGKQVAAALFIRDTYEQLAEETAQGQGEHLATVMNMFDCQGARQGAAVAATREAMGTLVSKPGFAELPRLDKATQFYGAVDAAVTHSCTI